MRDNEKMLKGALLKPIILFALPIAIGGILQQLFNAVDTAVVGRFASASALAAVGANAAVVNLLVVVFSSMSVGSSVVIAQDFGAEQSDHISAALHTSIAFAIASGVGLLIFGQVIARGILGWMSTPADIMDLAILYLRIYCLGMPFIMVYNFAAAVLRSAGDTKRPVTALIIAGVTNAVLNLIFVVIFHMSVAGVAIATVISNVISAAIVMKALIDEQGVLHFEWRKLAFDGKQLRRILRIGLPAGLQGLVFSLANVFIQSGVNIFGSEVVAGTSVAVNFDFISYYLISGFNQSALTFIGQNYGAKQYGRCREIFRICFIGAIASVTAMNAFFYLVRGFTLKLFTTNDVVIHYATLRMRYVLLLQGLAATYEISGSAMRAYGYSMMPAILTVIGTCVLRIVWVYVAKTIFQNYIFLILAYPVSWAVTGALVIGAYIWSSRKILVD